MNSLNFPCLCLITALLLTSACTPPPVHDPGLPPEHWIEQAANRTSGTSRPVVDVSSTSLDFDAALALAMQQSPLLTHSAIEMEIARLQTETASWNRLPEVRARFNITANVTRNDGSNDDEGYGKTAYRATLNVAAYNPVAATFSWKARQLMEHMALLNHAKAVEDLAERIGETLVRIETLRRLHAVQARLPNLAARMVDYSRALEPGEADRTLEYAHALQKLRVARALVDKTEAETGMQEAALKMLLGIPTEDSCYIFGPGTFLAGADQDEPVGKWQPAWETSPDYRMLETGMQLQDYNVLLAWSRYFPDVSLSFFSNNSRSSLYGSGSDDDLFVNAGISFPILDWGTRARGVVMARLQKTELASRRDQSRAEFATAWSHGLQEYQAIRAELALQQEDLELARLELRRARILYESSTETMRSVMEKEEQVIRQECSLIELQGRLRTWQIKGRIRSGALRATLLRIPAVAE